jgi:hypothetical protein
MTWRFGDPEDGIALAKSGLELARKAGDLSVICGALDAATEAATIGGRNNLAVEHSRERLALLGESPPTHALEVERSDALHMLVEALLRIGEFEEARQVADDATQRDLSRGLDYAAWQRGIMPAFYQGRWDAALEMSVLVRDGWIAAGRPPVSAFGGSVGTAGAISAFRGDAAGAASWFETADQLATGFSLHSSGAIRIWRSEADLHTGLAARAAERLEDPSTGIWWVPAHASLRAEVLAVSGHPDATAALAEAETRVGEDPLAGARLRRVNGILAEDEASLRQALEEFRALGCPFETARSAWRLGGEEREEATRLLEELGATAPV